MAKSISHLMNDLPARNEEVISKPLCHGNLNELMDETSAGESKKDTAENRQPRVLEMKFDENQWNSRRYEGMEEIDSIGCIRPVKHEARYASERVFQRRHRVDNQARSYSILESVQRIQSRP